MATAADTPSRVKVEIISVTPEMAAKWLETMGPNRRLNQKNVERLVIDMQRNNWHDNGAPVRFDKKGRLRDGQHRMEAVVRSGKTYAFHVIRDLDEKALQIVDTGKQRTFAESLAMREGAKAVAPQLAEKLSATAKLIWHYENGTILSSGQAVSHFELEGVMKRHPDLLKYVEIVAEGPVRPHAPLAFVFALGSEIAPRKAAQWMTQVQTGEQLRRGMPAYELRDILITQRAAGNKRPLRPVAIAALTVLSFNAFVDGDRGVTLEWRRTKRTADEPFPVIGGD